MRGHSKLTITLAPIEVVDFGTVQLNEIRMF
jgi:hypothetical protein